MVPSRGRGHYGQVNLADQASAPPSTAASGTYIRYVITHRPIDPQPVGEQFQQPGALSHPCRSRPRRRNQAAQGSYAGGATPASHPPPDRRNTAPYLRATYWAGISRRRYPAQGIPRCRRRVRQSSTSRTHRRPGDSASCIAVPASAPRSPPVPGGQGQRGCGRLLVRPRQITDVLFTSVRVGADRSRRVPQVLRVT